MPITSGINIFSLALLRLCSPASASMSKLAREDDGDALDALDSVWVEV